MWVSGEFAVQPSQGRTGCPNLVQVCDLEGIALDQPLEHQKRFARFRVRTPIGGEDRRGDRRTAFGQPDRQVGEFEQAGETLRSYGPLCDQPV